jgi:hypothetical protein
MTTRSGETPWPPPEHGENRRKFPPQELARYAGRFIAWSWDGTHILASGNSIEEVEAALKAEGTDPAYTVGDYVDPEE